MKKATLLLFVLISLTVAAQQSDIKGVVSIHNSQFKTGTRQYVQNAQVEDDFAKATPTTTDATGNFKLVFVGADKGKSVVLSIKKAGLQVVNTPDLTAVAGQTDALKISMAHPDSIAEYRKLLYNIGKSEAEKNLYAQLKKKGAAIEALQKDAQKNAVAIEKLQKEYAELDKYAKNIEEQAQDLARRYAPINLDDAAPLYREAFGYFQQGDLEKAMQILRGADLIGQADKILSEEEAIDVGRKELDKRDSIKQQRKKDLFQVLDLKADLHNSMFEWDSVLLCLKLRLSLDTTNAYSFWALGHFFSLRNENTKAIAFFRKALRLTLAIKTDSEKASPFLAILCDNLGASYNDIHEISDAEATFLFSWKIRKLLAENYPLQYEPDFAWSSANLGFFYQGIHKMPEAEKMYLIALEIFERLAKNKPLKFNYQLVMTLNNLAEFYRLINKTDEVEKLCLRALEISEHQVTSNPFEFKPVLANVQANLGNFYYKSKQLAKAGNMYLRSLELYEELAKNNPIMYEPKMQIVLNNMGLYYDKIKNLPEAEKMYLRTLEINERLAQKNSLQFEPELARILGNLGIFYKQIGKIDESEKTYLRALEIYERLVKKSLSKFEPELAQTYVNLSLFYLNVKPNKEKSLMFVKKALVGALPYVTDLESAIHTKEIALKVIRELDEDVDQILNEAEKAVAAKKKQ